MGNSAETQSILRNVLQRTHVVSNRQWDIVLRRFDVHVLEMEDVLFHHDSAVMMPDGPSAPAEDEAPAQDSQQSASGLNALALLFRALEEDPRKRILVAGHTDTTGSSAYNFELSGLRARNVLYLLSGQKDDWADACAQKHKIEDYQQILTYIASRMRGRWPCDPQGVDDTWGDNTAHATENFIQFYNNEFSPPDELRLDAFQTVRRIGNDARHNWPRELWLAVYDVYNRELFRKIYISAARLELMRGHLQWLGDERRWVACGESFPVDKAQHDEYRSQANRRVEILLFDQDEGPPNFECLDRRSTIHTEQECPLWPNLRLLPLHIDPRDLNSVTYHIGFTYIDAVKHAVCDLPDGLSIQAYENGSTELSVEQRYLTIGDRGVYAVKVRFASPLDDPARRSLHFEFRASGQFVYTPDAASSARIVTKSAAETTAMNRPEHLLERRKHYDLPERWSSRNYRTLYDGNDEGTDRFEDVLHTIKQLKPFGTNVTAPDIPLVFSLDDIVLLDSAGGTQDIKDGDHLIPANPKNLSNDSRIKILAVDAATGFLTLFKKGADDRSSRIPFARNYITEKPDDLLDARIVFFRDGFYTIGDKRTRPESNWETQGMVVGARAAVRSDSDFHWSQEMNYNSSEFGYTGDHVLHYFHHMHVEGDRPISFLMVYVSISFMADTRDATHAPVPSNADVQNYMDSGIYNAMAHWNRKRYYLEEDAPTDATTRIHYCYFFDERETFTVTRPSGGFNIDFDQRANHNTLFSHANLRSAQRNALGGRSNFLALICRDENGHWGPAYHWSVRDEGPQHYSLFKLNKSGGQAWPNMFGLGPVNEHGDSWGAHTFAHELGHATGQRDEYVKDAYKPDPTHNFSVPVFSQHFTAYSMPANGTSMMLFNRAPRLHHLWYSLHRINESLQTDPLRRMLGGKRFVARLDRGGFWDSRYTRHIAPATATAYQKPSVLDAPWKHDEQFELSHSPLKTLNIALHDIGRDETAIKYCHANQDSPEAIEYQAVLVVRAMLGIHFEGGGWTGIRKRQRVYELDQAWHAWREHYRLTGGAKDVQNIYVHFLIGFSSNPDDADRNYRLNLNWSNHPGHGDRIPHSGRRLKIHRNVNGAELARYLLDTGHHIGQPGALDALRDWVNHQLGEHFSIECF